MRRTPLDRRSGLKPSPGPARTAAMKRSRGFAASRAQRDKVRDLPCLVCGRDRYEVTVDPAHLCPRARGGCDADECVVPLCRIHHHMFDGGKLSILSELVAGRMHAELSHALGHLDCDLIGLLHRVTGERYVPDPVSEAA
jgi:hypothetical protein